MAVDGIHQVISVLEKIEMGELKNVVYCEAQACVGGCIGGVLAVQNPFIAKVTINHLLKKYTEFRPLKKEEMEEWRGKRIFERKEIYQAKEVLKLDKDFKRALEKYQIIEKLLEKLPGLDCGACGSPTCRALAEDIVRERAEEIDCPFMLRDRLLNLSEEIHALASKVPQTMAKKGGIKNLESESNH